MLRGRFGSETDCTVFRRVATILPMLDSDDAQARLQALNAEIGRRDFLRGSVFGGILLSSGFLFSGCGSYPEGRLALQVFTSKEFHILEKVMETFLPQLDDSVLSVSDARAVAFFDSLLVRAPQELVKNLKSLLWIFEHGTFLMAGKFSRFTKLSLQDRYEVLESFMKSDSALKKTIYIALMKITMGMYYVNDKTWQSIRYDGPIKPRPGAPVAIGNSVLSRLLPTESEPGPLSIPRK